MIVGSFLPQQASCSYANRTIRISCRHNSNTKHHVGHEEGVLELSGSQRTVGRRRSKAGSSGVARDRRRAVVYASNDGDRDQQIVENVDRSYCDDFVCTSSPSVELTVKALAKDIERGNGVWTKSLMAKGVEYKDAWCSTNGVADFQVDFIPKYCTPTEDVRVTRMRMVDQATASIEWSVVGTIKGIGPLSGTPVAVDMTTTIEMNLLTGQIEKREDTWKMASRSSLQGRLAWNLARAVWGSVVRSRMARKTSANLIEKSIDSVMGSVDDDEDAMSSYQADPMDPMKFFQQNDSFKDDAIALCIFLLVMYIIITGYSTVFSSSSSSSPF
ncbi:hypothetical protein M9434_005326 [Picochlorum sp. BPE23]|nr:hypothetical protein M9434_005326 [Picochlorum sp. BPE23]